MENLWNEVAEAREELEIALANFNHAVEKDAIDYWTYRILSAQTKYDHLIKEVKSQKAG